MENLPDNVKEVMKTVMKNKYTVKVYDKMAEKYDTHDWNIAELNTFLMSNNIKEIHLFKIPFLTDLSMEEIE